MSKFEEIDTNGRRSGRYLSMQRGGMGYLSADAIHEWFEGVERINIYVSQDGEEVALRPADEDGHVKLTFKEGNNGANFSAHSLLSELDASVDDLENATRISLSENGDGYIVGELQPLYEEVYHCCDETGCDARYKNRGDLGQHKMSEHQSAEVNRA